MKKSVMIAIPAITLLLVLGVVMNLGKKDTSEKVSTNDIALPVFQLEIPKEIGIHPYHVKASKVMEYYDGKRHDVDSITKFEGVYRSNQGIAYTYDNQNFEVVACFSGVVSEVKDDPVFGKSVTITHNDLKMTYQGLSRIDVNENSEIPQGALIGYAGESVYHKQLGNHLHFVVTLKDKLIDPEMIFNQRYEDIVPR